MRTTLLLSIVLLSASCATRSPDVSPPAAVPAAFTGSGIAALPDAWWTTLGDPALDAWMQETLAGNFSLRATWDRLAQAEATARKAGAGLRPSLDAAVSATRISREDEAGNTVETDEFTGGLIASYELDLWGRVRSTREAARFDLAATREHVRAAAVTLSAETANAWFQRAEQQGQIALLESQIETSTHILDLLRQRFRSGQSSAVDILQQEQLVEARRGDLSSARSRLAVLENQLTLLAGQPFGTQIPAPATPVILPPLPASGVPAELLQRRPDVLRAYHLVLAADRRAGAALADRFPRISLSARLASTEPEASDLFSNWITTLAANLTAPVLDGGSRRAETARTRAALSEAINTYRQTVLVALAEVENALTQEQRQREFVDSLARQLDLANQVTARTRDRYRSGGEDFLRILTADLSQQALARNLLTAHRQLHEFRIALCRALSGGFALERPEPAQLESETP